MEGIKSFLYRFVLLQCIACLVYGQSSSPSSLVSTPSTVTSVTPGMTSTGMPAATMAAILVPAIIGSLTLLSICCFCLCHRQRCCQNGGIQNGGSQMHPCCPLDECCCPHYMMEGNKTTTNMVEETTCNEQPMADVDTYVQPMTNVQPRLMRDAQPIREAVSFTQPMRESGAYMQQPMARDPLYMPALRSNFSQPVYGHSLSLNTGGGAGGCPCRK